SSPPAFAPQQYASPAALTAQDESPYAEIHVALTVGPAAASDPASPPPTTDESSPPASPFVAPPPPPEDEELHATAADAPPTNHEATTRERRFRMAGAASARFGPAVARHMTAPTTAHTSFARRSVHPLTANRPIRRRRALPPGRKIPSSSNQLG